MIQHEEIDRCTMFEAVISKNESVSAFERRKMTVVALICYTKHFCFGFYA